MIERRLILGSRLPLLATNTAEIDADAIRLRSLPVLPPAFARRFIAVALAPGQTSLPEAPHCGAASLTARMSALGQKRTSH